jgi:16S rRNA (guanine966-N2)-methyltransferase
MFWVCFIKNPALKTMLYIVAGKYKNRKISSPKSQQTRPTTSRLREALFNICQTYIEKAKFLDVFAGSGAMGLEALSRGAQEAVFIDGQRECIRCIRENLQALDLEGCGRPLQGDALALLKKLDQQREKFDIIYMDPPYQIAGLPMELIKTIDETSLLKPGGMLFIEDSKHVLIDNEGWNTLQIKSARKMGKSQLLQFEKI